jgi:hypothetical protein
VIEELMKRERDAPDFATFVGGDFWTCGMCGTTFLRFGGPAFDPATGRSERGGWATIEPRAGYIYGRACSDCQERSGQVKLLGE